MSSGLSQRELQILRYWMQGMQRSVIGERLGLSKRTIDAHLEHTFSKLDLHFPNNRSRKEVRRKIKSNLLEQGILDELMEDLKDDIE